MSPEVAHKPTSLAPPGIVISFDNLDGLLANTIGNRVRCVRDARAQLSRGATGVRSERRVHLCGALLDGRSAVKINAQRPGTGATCSAPPLVCVIHGLRTRGPNPPQGHER